MESGDAFPEQAMILRTAGMAEFLVNASLNRVAFAQAKLNLTETDPQRLRLDAGTPGRRGLATQTDRSLRKKENRSPEFKAQTEPRGHTMLILKCLCAAFLCMLFVSHEATAQTPLSPGTYNFRGPSGNTWDASWALNPSSGSPYYVGLSSLAHPPSTAQQFNFTSSGLLQSTANPSQYVYDLNGYLALGSSGDTFYITSHGPGYVIKNARANRLVFSSGGTGGGEQLSLASSGTVWTAASIGGPSTEIDDRNSAFVYSVWDSSNVDWYSLPAPLDYAQTEHSMQLDRQGGAHFTSASAAVTFSGTGITLIGKQGPNYGTVAYSVDGGPLQTVNNYNATQINQYPIVTVSNLANGSHVLWVEEADSNVLTIDAAKINGVPVTLSQGTIAGYNSTHITYSGDWPNCSACLPGTDLSGGHSISGNAGDSMSWTFNGSLIEVFGRPDYEDGYMYVFIDGAKVSTVDLRWGGVDDDSMNSTLIYAYKTATAGTHTIKLVAAGYADSGGPAGENTNLIQFDEFVAFP
jgi:hypothetical protein